MLKLKKVAITGGLSSGKTSVCRFLEKQGACVACADEIVRTLLTPKTRIGQKVIHIFGPDIERNGTIDRKLIANIVFKHPKKLEALEKALHPEVIKAIEQKYIEACKSKTHLFYIAEIPLLFEAHMENQFDITIFVDSLKPLRMDRFIATGLGDQQNFEAREKRMLPHSEKIAQVDFVISNNKTMKELEQEALKLGRELKEST